MSLRTSACRLFEKHLSSIIEEDPKEKWFEYILNHPEKPWSWRGISCNPNLTMEMIEAHPEKPWDWWGISRNLNITMEMIEAYPEKPWWWYGISCNPNITMEMIEAYPEKPWNWWAISHNLNLTIEMIEARPKKPWNWRGISQNKLNFESICKQKYNDQQRELYAVIAIQIWWREILYNPYTKVGSRHLEKTKSHFYSLTCN